MKFDSELYFSATEAEACRLWEKMPGTWVYTIDLEKNGLTVAHVSDAFVAYNNTNETSLTFVELPTIYENDNNPTSILVTNIDRPSQIIGTAEVIAKVAIGEDPLL